MSAQGKGIWERVWGERTAIAGMIGLAVLACWRPFYRWVSASPSQPSQVQTEDAPTLVYEFPQPARSYHPKRRNVLETDAPIRQASAREVVREE
jgi:hypothetical protein